MKAPLIARIFGKVEINTIIKKMEGKKLKQTEKNYLYRSIRPKLMAASMLAESGILKEINAKPVGRGAVLIPVANSSIFEEFLEKWKIKYQSMKILAT